jgi:hypothetical protein
MTSRRVDERVTTMVRSADHGPGVAAPADGDGAPEAAAGVEQIEAALETARTATPGQPDSVQFLVALALLRQLREQLAGWEPELIDAARANGASWAQLAPALGVASRQAAERRALRLRPSGDQDSTGDQRVAAERGRRAQARAVNAWARDRSADLRVLAAQIGGLTGLPKAADGAMAALHVALGGADAADLLQPLIDTRPHLDAHHPALAARIDMLTDDAETVRADTRAHRRT